MRTLLRKFIARFFPFMVSVVTEFRTKFTLLDMKPPARLRRVQTEENNAAVSASVNDDHQLAIHRRLQQLDLCYSTTWNFTEGFRCEAFQNTAGAGIEAKRPTATQNLKSWPKIHFFINFSTKLIFGSMGT